MPGQTVVGGNVGASTPIADFQVGLCARAEVGLRARAEVRYARKGNNRPRAGRLKACDTADWKVRLESLRYGSGSLWFALRLGRGLALLRLNIVAKQDVLVADV
jgi:hypothetical protein